MDEILRRAALSFMGLSIGIFAIAEAMVANGSAVPSNPAWHLIAMIRSLFIWAWVILAAVGFAGLLVHYFAKVSEVKSHEREQILVRERSHSIQSQRQEICQSQESRLREPEAAKRANAERQAKERDEAIKIEIEHRRTRSPDDAVNAAFDDL